MTNRQPVKRKWFRRLWVISLMVASGLVLAALAVITFVPLDDVEVGGTSLNLELQTGKIEASNNLSASSSVSSSSQAMLDLRRVMIINLSDHMVMRKVTERVAERLRAAPVVDTVDVYNVADGDDWPNQGGRLYDFYLTLDMPRFDTSGLVVAGRRAEATVSMNGGQDPWDSRHGYTDHLTPPIVRINVNATLQHRSTTTGYESAGARYKLMIENIADQLAESLAKNFGEWSAKHPSFGDVPDEFRPTYRPVPDDLPLSDSPDLVRVISGSGLLVHNCSVWMMPTDDPVAALRDLRDRLNKAGWHGSERDDIGEDIWSRHFRTTADKGSRIYEAYQVRPDNLGGDMAPARIVIEYRDRMTREETQPTIDRLLTEDSPPLATLLSFDRAMTSEQSKRLTELMLNAPPTGLPTHAHLRVARHLLDKGMEEQAMAYLSAAYFLARAADASTDEIEKLAKEITGQDKWKPDPPTEAELEQLGLGKLRLGDSFTTEVNLDEPVVCYQMTSPEEIGYEGATLISVTVLRSAIPEGRYALRVGHRAISSGWGGSDTSTPHDLSSPWRCQLGAGMNDLSWGAEAEEIGKDRFRITLRAWRDEPPSTSR